jgi:hypothetical protein
MFSGLLAISATSETNAIRALLKVEKQAAALVAMVKEIDQTTNGIYSLRGRVSNYLEANGTETVMEV